MLDRVVIRYDLERYPFPDIVRSHVGCDLTRLHEHYAFERLIKGTEQHTTLHKLLYEIGPAFFDAYRAFLVGVIQPALGGELLYQRTPNFRFQLPRNVAVRGFHKDRDDGHQAAEINCWVPLTPVRSSSAVWIETTAGAGDHRPAMVQPGEVLIFDGANLEHGNVESCDALTRVSFDFRVVRSHAFVSTTERSVYRQVRFAIGDYFEEL